MINLVRDYSEAATLDEEGYLHLNLRHNRMNDPDVDHFLWGVASFRMDDITSEFPDIKGLKIAVRTLHDGTRDYTCDFDHTVGDSSTTTSERSLTATSVK